MGKTPLLRPHQHDLHYAKQLANTVNAADIESLRDAMLQAYPGMKRFQNGMGNHALISTVAGILFNFASQEDLIAMSREEFDLFMQVNQHFLAWRAAHVQKASHVKLDTTKNAAGDTAIFAHPPLNAKEIGDYTIALAQKLDIAHPDYLVDIGLELNGTKIRAIKDSASSREFVMSYAARHIPELLALGRESDGRITLHPKQYKNQLEVDPNQELVDPKYMVRNLDRLAQQYVDKLNNFVALLGARDKPFKRRQDNVIVVGPRNAARIADLIAQYRQAYPHIPKFGDVGVTHAEFGDDYPKAAENPEFRHLFQGMHMLMHQHSAQGKPTTLESYVNDRGYVLDAIALIRPDLADIARRNMEKSGEDPGRTGLIPLTPRQISELKTSFKRVMDALGADDLETGLGELKKSHELHPVPPEPQSFEKPEKPKPEIAGGSGSLYVLGAARAAKSLAGSPRAIGSGLMNSPNDFITSMEGIRGAFDTVERLVAVRDAYEKGEAIDEENARIQPNAGTILLRLDTAQEAQVLEAKLSEFVSAKKVDFIRYRPDISSGKKHWLALPIDCDNLAARLTEVSTEMSHLGDLYPNDQAAAQAGWEELREIYPCSFARNALDVAKAREEAAKAGGGTAIE